MYEMIKIFSVDFLNAIALYAITSPFVFIYFYLIKNKNFQTSTITSFVYICLFPIMIPLATYLFNLLTSFLITKGMSYYSVSKLFYLEHLNLETIGKSYGIMLGIGSIFILILLPFRLLAGDTIKDICVISFMIILIFIPILMFCLYVLAIFVNLIGRNVDIPYKYIYSFSPQIAVCIILPVVTLISFYVLKFVASYKK